jgi:hypothetical protein
MSPLRSLRVIVLALASSLCLALGAAQLAPARAAARPVRIGPVTGLAATVSKPGAAYSIAATWNALAGATSYRTSVTRGGTTLASATVTSPSWSASVTAAPGAVTLTVIPVAKHKPGTAASITVNLPDLTAPSGTYTTTWTDAGDATLTQASLTDDSPVSQITRVVSWGDGSAPQTWTGTGTTLTHHYAALGRYVPSVTLTDAAGNAAVIAVPAVVIGDHTAPTGGFGLARVTAWATLTPVQIVQNSLSDDYSPPDFISRVVDWGDGSAPDSWAPGTTLSHVYGGAGTFTPAVTITDEAHNSAVVAATAVTVKADTTSPVVRLLTPQTKVHSVRSWTTLHGKANDVGGTGVKLVTVNVVEKRATGWFAYHPGTKKWVTAATKAKAFARSKAFVLTTNARNRWAAAMSGLRRGKLVYRVVAYDMVGNRSAVVKHGVTLTQR